MESIDILLGRNGADDRLLANVLGQWQLYQQSVHVGIAVGLVYDVEQLLLGRGLGQIDQMTIEADVFAGGNLIADIDLRGGILAHEDYIQSGGTLAVGNQGTNLSF